MSFGAYAVQVNQGVVSSVRGAVGGWFLAFGCSLFAQRVQVPL